MLRPHNSRLRTQFIVMPLRLRAQLSRRQGQALRLLLTHRVAPSCTLSCFALAGASIKPASRQQVLFLSLIICRIFDCCLSSASFCAHEQSSLPTGVFIHSLPPTTNGCAHSFIATNGCAHSFIATDGCAHSFIHCHRRVRSFIHSLPPTGALIHSLPPAGVLIHSLPPTGALIHSLPPMGALIHSLPPTGALIISSRPMGSLIISPQPTGSLSIPICISRPTGCSAFCSEFRGQRVAQQLPLTKCLWS